MKTKLTTSLILLLFCQIANGQNNTYPEPTPIEPAMVLYQKDIYQDSSTLTVFQQVIRTDSVGIAELKTRFKNWGAKSFVNLSQIMVSETDDQIVLVYIVNIPWAVKSAVFGTVSGNSGWYVRLVANFKGDRVRITQTDDGNVAIPPTASTPGLSARSRYLTSYFARTGKIDPNKSMNRQSYEMAIKWRNEILSTLVSCGNALTQPTVKTDDW